MQIKSVTYRRVFEDEAIEATAEVDEQDDPDKVLQALRDWVEGQLLRQAMNRVAAGLRDVGLRGDDDLPF